MIRVGGAEPEPAPAPAPPAPAPAASGPTPPIVIWTSTANAVTLQYIIQQNETYYKITHIPSSAPIKTTPQIEYKEVIGQVGSIISQTFTNLKLPEVFNIYATYDNGLTNQTASTANYGSPTNITTVATSAPVVPIAPAPQPSPAPAPAPARAPAPAHSGGLRTRRNKKKKSKKSKKSKTRKVRK